MTTNDQDFAKKITAYLDQGTANLKAGVAYRLQSARQQALAQLADPERAASLRLAGARAGVGDADGDQWVALGSGECCVHGQLIVFKGGITQAMAEGEERVGDDR